MATAGSFTGTVESSSDTVPTIRGASDPEIEIEVLKSVPKHFAIDCEEHANWLVRKIVAARNYAERVKAWAEREQHRAAREEQTLIFLFGRQIEGWAKTEIEKLKGRRKSINLPAGSVGFRAVGPRLVIDDEAVVLKWAKFNLPDAVVLTEKLSKSIINENAEKTGLIPDEGVHIEPPSETFFIR